MTKDLIAKGRLEGIGVAFVYASVPETVSDAMLRHGCDPASAHLLARAITAGLLAASVLDSRERINIRWTYEGMLRTILVDAGPDGSVRGLIQPRALSDAQDVMAIMGARGELRVIRFSDDIVTASGTTEARLLDVVEDFAMHLCVSDQVESAMMALVGFSPTLSQPISVCRGLLLQALPNSDLAIFNRLREGLDSPDIRDLMASPTEEEHLPETIVERLVGWSGRGVNMHMENVAAPRFQCNCTREKAAAILRAFPATDRKDILASAKPLTVRCHFCNKAYVLTPEECRDVWMRDSDLPGD